MDLLEGAELQMEERRFKHGLGVGLGLVRLGLVLGLGLRPGQRGSKGSMTVAEIQAASIMDNG